MTDLLARAAVERIAETDAPLGERMRALMNAYRFEELEALVAGR